MKYQYDGGSRVVKSATRSNGETLYTVYPFSTLELRSTGLTGSGSAQDYALNTDTTQLRLSGGAVSGRVLYNATMPRTGTSNVHLFLEFGDHLGSTTFTIDHATSEVVEYVSYMAYGQAENDYRTSRWSNFREPYRFTGKEEDVEVGLNYHGARYYSPALKRWMSADPVTVHEAGSDINPYSYGNGNPTANVDPDGREIISLTVILVSMAVSAVVSSGVYAYSAHKAGVAFGSKQWWTGLGIAAGTGAVGGAAGAIAGAAVGSWLGASAGTWWGVGLSSASAGAAS
jgi:RHS repeat-associated protein